ncbi:MAG: hypothetical protein ABIV50_07445 [Opitutus sp.]
MKMILLRFLLGLGAISAAAAAGTSPTPGESSPAAAAKSAPAKPVIHMGMTPEAVAKLIGQPVRVEPVKTPAGDGFRWVYRRLTKEYLDDTAVGVNMVPSFVGLARGNQGMGDAAMPAHQFERVRVYQTSSLLFVGGKLVGSTQWPVTERSFQQ